MGRNIKHYNGYYKAQTSNQWDSTSTGYTVPSGKVARIGFKLASSGGAQSAPSGDSKAIGGFFAGTNGAGTTSTGHNTNRFLLVYTPGADKDQSETNFTQNIDYNENNGHRWSLTASDTNHTPRLYIGDHMRERYTNRSNSQYMYNNFGIANSDSNSERFGTLGWSNQTSTTQTSQMHHLFFHTNLSQNGSYSGSGVGFLAGSVHAFAGETIYLFDQAYHNYNSWDYRAFGKVQWHMFIIEEDA